MLVAVEPGGWLQSPQMRWHEPYWFSKAGTVPARRIFFSHSRPDRYILPSFRQERYAAMRLTRARYSRIPARTLAMPNDP